MLLSLRDWSLENNKVIFLSLGRQYMDVGSLEFFFGELLFEVLDNLGITPSKTEPQIWMRIKDGIYEYIQFQV